MEYVTPETQHNLILKNLVEESIAASIEDSSRMSSKRPPRIRKMYLAAFSALLMAVAMGMATGYSAPATYDMTTRKSSPVKPTEEGITWIGSILALGAMCGGLIAGPAADKVGRKTLLMLNILPFITGWLSICFAKDISGIIAGRLLTGIACGVVSVAVPVYCVEISTPEVRGLLGSSFQGFMVLGNLFCVVIGSLISWQYLALVGAAVATFGLLCFYSMPESPRWLLSQNDMNGAMVVMRYLQGDGVNVKEECENIHRDIQGQPKGMLTWKECKHPAIYKPAIIAVILMFFQQFSGANAVLFYSSEIFQGGSFLDPKESTVILGIVQVVATLLSNVIVDKAGRKSLLLISGAFMSLSLAALGIYYYKSAGDAVFRSHFNWIPLLSLVAFLIAFSLGYGSIPWLLAAEMVPLRARSTIGGLATFANGLCAFTITKTFSELEYIVCNYGTFWTYSVLSVIGCVFVFLVLPETKGKELKEITDYFSRSTHVEQELSISVISK